MTAKFVRKTEICKHCDGTGQGKIVRDRPCPYCNGAGEVRTMVPLVPLPPLEQPAEQSTIEIHEISTAIREAITAVREAKEATHSHELTMIQTLDILVEAVRELTHAVRNLPEELIRANQ